MSNKVSHSLKWSDGEPVVRVECPDHGTVVPILTWTSHQNKIQARCPVTGHYLKWMPTRVEGIAEATQIQALQVGSTEMQRYWSWRQGRKSRRNKLGADE